MNRTVCVFGAMLTFCHNGCTDKIPPCENWRKLLWKLPSKSKWISCEFSSFLFSACIYSLFSRLRLHRLLFVFLVFIVIFVVVVSLVKLFNNPIMHLECWHSVHSAHILEPNEQPESSYRLNFDANKRRWIVKVKDFKNPKTMTTTTTRQWC